MDSKSAIELESGVMPSNIDERVFMAGVDRRRCEIMMTINEARLKALLSDRSLSGESSMGFMLQFLYGLALTLNDGDDEEISILRAFFCSEEFRIQVHDQLLSFLDENHDIWGADELRREICLATGICPV